MRVDDQIRLHAALGEGHIDGRPKLRANTLLTVTRRELVTNDGLTRDAVLHTERLGGLVAVLRAHDANALDIASFGVLVLDVMRDAIDIDERVSSCVVADVVVGGDLITLLDPHTDMRQTVSVNQGFGLGADLITGREAEELGDFTLGLAAARVALSEAVHLGLVDGTVTEPALVSRLVDDHSVVHVVTSVGDNGHDSVRTIGEVVQTVFIVQRCSDDGCLTGLQAVQLVVCTVVDCCTGGTHGLLAHLALVHVTGRLVVVGEGGHVGHNREDVGRRVFNVGGKTGNQVGFQTGNLHERLLEGTHKVQSLIGQVLHWTVHPCRLREHVDTGVLTAVGVGNITDFQAAGNGVGSGDLPVPKSVVDLFGLLGRAETNDTTVQLNDDTVIDGNGRLGPDSKLNEDLGQVGDLEVVRGDETLVGQMV